jgi:hypothetical protein
MAATATPAVFGLPLGKAVPAGAQVPEVVEHCLQVLAFCTPANPDMFDMPITHPDVTALRTAFDAYDSSSGADSPVSNVENPQVRKPHKKFPNLSGGEFFPDTHPRAHAQRQSRVCSSCISGVCRIRSCRQSIM